RAATLAVERATQGAVEEAVRAVVQAATTFAQNGQTRWAVEAASAAVRERLLRHIVGNPFRPYPAPSSWPAAVVQLAEALLGGTDCRAPLHDALLEAGHPDLAEHFRHEREHPRGCFALDAIFGKT